MRGMHETLDLQGVLDGKVSAIDHFALYETQAKDQELKSVLHRQATRMVQDYNNMVNLARGRGVDPRSLPPTMTHTHNDVNYGMQQGGQPSRPQTQCEHLSDRAIAQGMMMHHKCSATCSTNAALESADAELRQMMTNDVVTSINMAYETFQVMNAKGWHQVPTMDQRTMSQIGQSYQPVGMGNATQAHPSQVNPTPGVNPGMRPPGPAGSIGGEPGLGSQFGNFAGSPTLEDPTGNRAEHISPENFKM